MIEFENKNYELKVSWYKNNNRICVYLKNSDEEIYITTNDNTLKINQYNVAILDSFVSDTSLLQILKDKKIIVQYQDYEFFEAIAFDLNALSNYDLVGVNKFLKHINSNEEVQ